MAKTKIDSRQLKINARDSVAVASVGANIVLASACPNVIDGITLALGDRVLVKDQTDPIENGIYVVTTLGTGVNGVWDRAIDMDEDAEVRYGDYVLVVEGTANGKRVFLQTEPDELVVATDAQEWELLADTDTGLPLASFVHNETPTGTLNGSNTDFDTAVAFATDSLRVYLNGQRLQEGATEDYTISGTTITFADAPRGNPGNTDVILVDYIKA